MEPWEKQRLEKYEYHDFSLDDMSQADLETLRSRAVHQYATTASDDRLKIIMELFMGYLTKQGFRITKG